MYLNGRSFDNSFSSIMQAVQSQSIADIFATVETTGKEANKKAVASTKIKLVVTGKAQRFQTQE